MVRSCYDVLGLERNASLEDIKVAFKRRALQVHPDKGGSKEAFHSVYQAFEILADSEARKKHDHSLATWKAKVALQPRNRKRKNKAAASASNAGAFTASDLPSNPQGRLGQTGRQGCWKGSIDAYNTCREMCGMM